MDKEVIPVIDQNFRSFYHKFLFVLCDNLAESFGNLVCASEDDNGFLCYGYVDYNAGISFRLLCSAHFVNDQLVLNSDFPDTTVTIRFESILQSSFIEITSVETNLSCFDSLVANIKADYESFCSSAVALRDVTELDPLRHPFYPDDIQVTFIGEHVEGENTWVKVVKESDGYLWGILLVEPYQNLHVHKGDVVPFCLVNLDDGQVGAFHINNDIQDSNNYIQSFIANVSTSKTFDEILVKFQQDGELTSIQPLVQQEYVEWTAPRWAKQGDAVFFMYSKSSLATVRHLRAILPQFSESFADQDLKVIKASLDLSEKLYSQCGGCIFAVGRVTGKLINDSNAAAENRHWKSSIYAPIDDIVLLDNPIPYDDFKNFIKLSMQSSITPVFGSDYEQLKGLIASRNEIPPVLQYGKACSTPLAKIDESNWIEFSGTYRHNFFLEKQFRRFFVDYLLARLGDQKKFFEECATYKNGKHTGFVDNIIIINKKYLPVEVKLNINGESDLPGQCRKYCKLSKLILDEKSGREAPIDSIVSDRVLIIDTNGLYLYRDSSSEIIALFSLENLKQLSDLNLIKSIVENALL